MNQLLLGAIGMSFLVAGLFFARFWKTTRDRFFLLFAASFWIEGLNRFLMGAAERSTAELPEELPLFYLIRLASFLLIIAAIIDKNRGRAKP